MLSNEHFCNSNGYCEHLIGMRIPTRSATRDQPKKTKAPFCSLLIEHTATIRSCNNGPESPARPKLLAKTRNEHYKPGCFEIFLYHRVPPNFGHDFSATALNSRPADHDVVDYFVLVVARNHLETFSSTDDVVFELQDFSLFPLYFFGFLFFAPPLFEALDNDCHSLHYRKIRGETQEV